MFALSLVGNMDKLEATRIHPGLSYLHTAKQDTAVINVVLLGLAISNYPTTEECFLSEVVKDTMSMKSARNAIKKYDTELPLVIELLGRLTQRSKPLLE